MKCERFVFDTNVIISGFIFGGYPQRLINYVNQGVIRCFISVPILEEVRGVLLRPKFNLSAELVFAFIEELYELCEIVSVDTHVDVVSADPDDNMILECALAAGADIISSGDAHLLDIGCWRGIKILSPADAVNLIIKKRGLKN